MTVIKTTLSEQAYRELRARIISGQLPGGTRLLPNELAADLGISPTPVKEACLRLESDGLLVNSARRGMIVRSFTVEDVLSLYGARILIEKGAVEMAFDTGRIDQRLHDGLAQSLEGHRRFARGVSLDDLAQALAHDRAFHGALVAAAGIPLITETHERILGQTHTLFVSVPGDYGRSVEEHQEILTAIAERKKAETIDALLRHLNRSRENTLRQVRVLSKLGPPLARVAQS